jgi:Predicted integral membrane protein
MINKERLAGLIDAIIAVIMTIMLLEFHTGESGSLSEFIKENVVYLIAYLLSFYYVVVSWANQQYMMKHAKVITRKIYLSIMLWVLSLSLLPILAAWTGKTIDLFDDFGLHSPKAPALLFLAMIVCWGLAYVKMSKAFIADNPKEQELLVGEMAVFKYLTHPIWIFSIVVAVIITYFYPPFVFIYTAFEMIAASVIGREAFN